MRPALGIVTMQIKKMDDSQGPTGRLAHLDGITPIDNATIAALESDARVHRALKAHYQVIDRVTGELLGAYPTLGGASACAALSMLLGREPLIATNKIGKGE